MFYQQQKITHTLVKRDENEHIRVDVDSLQPCVQFLLFFYLLLFSFLFVSRCCCGGSGCCYCCCLLLHIIFSERIYFLGNLNKRLAEELSEAEEKKRGTNEQTDSTERKISFGIYSRYSGIAMHMMVLPGECVCVCVEPKKMATDKELCFCRRDGGITQDTTSIKKKQAKNAEYKHSTERFYLLV